MNKVLGKAYVYLDTLTSVIRKVFAIINGRLLTFISSNGDDPKPLCPTHLLHVRRLNYLPYPVDLRIDNMEGHENSRTCIYRLTDQNYQLIQHFWKRWTQEYLTALVLKKQSIKPGMLC